MLIKRGTQERHRESAKSSGLRRTLRTLKNTTHHPTLPSTNKTKENHHHLLMEGQMFLSVPIWKYCPSSQTFFFLKYK